MGATLSGLVSGIDTESFISQMVDVEYNKVRTVQASQKQVQLKIDAYTQFKSLISDMGKKASDLETAEDFNLFKITNSNDKIATFEATTNAVAGKYDLKVFQLAQYEKMVSKDALITSQSAALSTFGVTPGDISVDGVTITIDADDTIQDLRLKINTGKTADGKKLGVSASVLKVADNNFRLVLTSTKPGASGVSYSDVTGSTLQDLGIITNAAGDKGNQTQVLKSTNDFATAFANLAVGQSIEYSGKDREGNAVSNLFVKGAGSTLDQFRAQVKSTFHNMAEVTTDADGKLTVTDSVTGSSQLNLSSMTIGGVAETISISQAGANGDGVQTVGRKAYYSIDGMTMESDSNSISNAVSGVNVELLSADVNTSISVEMKRDLDGITAKVQSLLTAYNALVRFDKDNTKYADPNDKTSSKGKLAGDMTVRSILSRIRTVFQTRFTDIGSIYETASQVGIKTDPKTGEFALDSKVFKENLEKNYEDLTSLFITKGFSANPNISIGRFTDDTTVAKYDLEEVDATHVRIRKQGDTDWTTSLVRNGDVVTFDAGAAKGLSLSMPAGVLGGSASTFTFNRGLGELISNSAEQLTNSAEGLVGMRQKSLSDSTKRMDDRITKMTASIEAYRLRMVKQFSALEQAMSKMKSQSASMTSALGSS